MKINEIFRSICGEGSELGLIATFVRFTGCDSRCNFCDTTYSFFEGRDYEFDELIKAIEDEGVKRVFWTGGEPLLYAGDVAAALRRLPKADGWEHIIQTNGKHSCAAFVSELSLLSIDWKGPSAGPTATVNVNAIVSSVDAALRKNIPVQLKFLVQDEVDFEFAKSHIRECIEERRWRSGVNYIIGPVGGLDMRVLAEQVLADPFLGKLNSIRVGCQVHKLLWGNKRGV